MGFHGYAPEIQDVVQVQGRDARTEGRIGTMSREGENQAPGTIYKLHEQTTTTGVLEWNRRS
jgi:hypothetical protein